MYSNIEIALPVNTVIAGILHRDPYCGTVLTLYNSTMNSDKAPVHDQVGVKETAARDGINVVAHALGATVGLGGSE